MNLILIIREHITPLTVLAMVMVIVAVVLFTKAGVNAAVYKKNKMKYLIKKGNVSLLKQVSDELMRVNLFKKIIRKIALKIGMVSKYSYEKNLEIATGLIFGSFVTALLIIFLIVPSSNLLWYELVYYLFIAGALITITFYVIFANLRSAFIAKLPDVYKVLNSRYISKGNILKAIDVSLDDFDRVIRKEMMKIYNILKKNNMDEINDAFKEIELTYNTEYLTILLSLIKQAHFKGGNDMIKEQFENLTEEILQEIENKAELSSASKSYIVMSIFIVPVMEGVEIFNKDAIGSDLGDYYSQPAAKGLFLATLVAVLLYIGLMLFLEKKV